MEDMKKEEVVEEVVNETEIVDEIVNEEETASLKDKFLKKKENKEIEKLNLRKKFVRHELFGEYFNPDKEEDYPTNVNPTFSITVRIAGKEQTIVANANDSILRSLEKNGIKLN